MTGIVCCYLGFAYSLYLLKHNVELQLRLINRLKEPKQFQGAYYEVIIANCLIRAGFELTLEDETDDSIKHCEFSAVSKTTEKKYWIEVKMRAVAGRLGKTKADGAPDRNPFSSFSKQLKEALEKPALDERLIFIDLNGEPLETNKEVCFGKKIIEKLKAREMVDSSLAAYVFAINMAFHRALWNEPEHAVMAYGLNIPDFCKKGNFRLSELYRQKKKHIDAYNIRDSIQNYPQLPDTFDGSLPSVSFNKNNQNIIIGENYIFKDVDGKEIRGIVTSACVDEAGKTVYVGIKEEDGKASLIAKPMSHREFMDYKRHPEAFFRKIRYPAKELNTDELFEFFVEVHQNTPKEKLIELMKESKSIDELNKMEHTDLLFEYCEGMVYLVTKNKRL